MGELTINELIRMAHDTAEANGWHEEPYPVVTGEAPKARIAALAPILVVVARAVEIIRKPEDFPYLSLEDVMWDLQRYLNRIRHIGLSEVTTQEAGIEVAQPIMGSKVQVKAHLILMATEIAEAIEAIDHESPHGFRLELADLALRLGNLVGSLNNLSNYATIDLEAEIQRKNEYNRTRGYRHGGKLA